MTAHSKKILGIDPGTQITGYGMIECLPSSYKTIDFGCIKTPSTLSPPEKYLFISNGVEELIKRYTPDIMVVETQFFYKNAASALKIGMARGVVLVLSARYKTPIFEYAPKKVKQAVTGTGSASKETVQRMIQLLLKLPTLPEPEDAADALALALCHAHTLKGSYVGIH